MRYRLFPLVACVLASACGGDGSNGAEKRRRGASLLLSAVYPSTRPRSGPASVRRDRQPDGQRTVGSSSSCARRSRRSISRPGSRSRSARSSSTRKRRAEWISSVSSRRTGCFLPRVPDRIVRVRDAPSPTLALPRASSSRTGTAGSWFLPRTPRPSNRRHRRLRRSASQETSLMPIQTGVNRT
jgi:hypothetical protein